MDGVKASEPSARVTVAKTVKLVMLTLLLMEMGLVLLLKYSIWRDFSSCYWSRLRAKQVNRITRSTFFYFLRKMCAGFAEIDSSSVELRPGLNELKVFS